MSSAGTFVLENPRPIEAFPISGSELGRVRIQLPRRIELELCAVDDAVVMRDAKSRGCDLRLPRQRCGIRGGITLIIPFETGQNAVFKC